MNALKELLDKLFLWCSDTDISTLNLVNEQDRKSKRYQINYGRLVLIPTIMAILGVAHAMSDFTTNLYIYIGIGLMVGWIVFAVDRAIIATYEKKEKGLGKQFWWRLSLSTIMGFVIAVFFVFFFFENRINAQIETDKRTKNSNTNIFYDSYKDSISSHLKEKREYLIFLDEVRQAELDGIKGTFKYGDLEYTTTGQRGRSISTIGREKQIEELKSEISRIDAEIKPRLVEIENNRTADLDTNEEDAKKKDPLIKLEMLIEIIKQHHWLLLLIIPLYLFLLVLDIIPILVKELAQVTKYDNFYRNKKLSEVNLNYTEYNKKTQEVFDKSYVQNFEQINPPKSDSMWKKLEENLKEQNWQVLSVLGFLCGLCVWVYKSFYDINSYSESAVIVILFAIIGNLITVGLQKLADVIKNWLM